MTRNENNETAVAQQRLTVADLDNIKVGDVLEWQDGMGYIQRRTVFLSAGRLVVRGAFHDTEHSVRHLLSIDNGCHIAAGRPTFEAEQFTATGNMGGVEYSAEASELGLPPGMWPNTFYLRVDFGACGNRFDLIGEERGGGKRYQIANTTITATIFND